jgi:hypothetical protein
MPSAGLAIALQIQVSMWDFRSHSLWAWLLIELIAGWLTGLVFRGRGFGCVTAPQRQEQSYWSGYRGFLGNQESDVEFCP